MGITHEFLPECRRNFQLLRIDPSSGSFRFTYTVDRDIFDSEVRHKHLRQRLHSMLRSTGVHRDRQSALTGECASLTCVHSTPWLQAKAIDYLRQEGAVQVRSLVLFASTFPLPLDAALGACFVKAFLCPYLSLPSLPLCFVCSL